MLIKKVFLIFFFCLLVLSGCFFSKSSLTTLGDYYGVSKDKKWETNFKVFQHNEDIILKGEVICIDDKLIKKFSNDELKKNQITLVKENGIGFGGNFLYDDNKFTNKFTIINFVKNDGSTYEKMTIAIGDYKVELKINKVK
ncbi:hypothetical protein [Fonticella tunisiensis]|uniref:Lipoprotein n=1 Tax=Fonticella tunisiensis TaxID=1096341 RepID=A0A4R7KUQ1_9CLOT|nr:hypothetical protein [Fonticella tunisiensis]TDT63799.1 hypothetical protein EDD71_101226 [Fonticella tunisiensis]